MKKRVLRKALLLVTCGLMLVSVTVGATLAYLTDTHSVVNTFTVGNVGLSIDEAAVDLYGQPVEGASRRTENNYKLLPGQTYTKDPTITIDSNSEDGWLFVRVANEIAPIEAASGSIASQMETLGWTAVEGTADVYAYQIKAQADNEITVFDTFTISGEVNNTTLAAYQGKQILVTAYLVQAAGFDTAADAWNATKGEFAYTPSTPVQTPVAGDNGTLIIPVF